jgi:DNA-binding transcriptional MocR family regulator
MEVTEAMIGAGRQAAKKLGVMLKPTTLMAIYTAMRALEPRASSDGDVVGRAVEAADKTLEGSYFVDHRLRCAVAEAIRAALNAAALQSQPSGNEARLREALEIVAGGDVDVSDTAIIVGNGASTVMRQIHAALSNEGNG